MENEEVSRLRHSVRVLQGTLQVEKQLAHEYYTELCSKIQEYEDLNTDYNRLERKLDRLQHLSDVEDELTHATACLASAEREIAGYKAKIESLEGCKQMIIELEGKLSKMDSLVASCEEYKLVSASCYVCCRMGSLLLLLYNYRA